MYFENILNMYRLWTVQSFIFYWHSLPCMKIYTNHHFIFQCFLPWPTGPVPSSNLFMIFVHFFPISLPKNKKNKNLPLFFSLDPFFLINYWSAFKILISQYAVVLSLYAQTSHLHKPSRKQHVDRKHGARPCLLYPVQLLQHNLSGILNSLMNLQFLGFNLATNGIPTVLILYLGIGWSVFPTNSSMKSNKVVFTDFWEYPN